MEENSFLLPEERPGAGRNARGTSKTWRFLEYARRHFEDPDKQKKR